MYTLNSKTGNIPCINGLTRQRFIIMSPICVGLFFLLIIYGLHGSSEFEPSNADKYGGPIGVAFNKTYEFGIMFDAGSTGSRIHVYKFIRKQDSSLELEDELFLEVKPGLSSYAKDPKKGAASIRELLNQGKGYIPEELWKKTPVALKATAGLRLLPEEKSKALLTEVEDLFKSYPFKVVENAVQIMDGSDEGIFSWFTINFLLGKMDTPKKTVGMMDLGGGSMQIAFIPNKKETLEVAPKSYLHDIKLKNENVQLFTHSYLGLGLMSARLQIFGRKDGDADTNTPLSSPCMPSDHSGRWKHQGHEFEIKSEYSQDFSKCLKKVQAVVGNYKMVAPNEIKEKTMYAFSYFFDRAVESGMLDEKKGGELTVANYYNRAKAVCSSGELGKKHPFMCLDLCYISSLLLDGFKFDKDSKLMLKKKIRGVETAWSLGATFQIM